MTKRERDQRHDARRRQRPYRRWYSTRTWKLIRAQRLAEEPLCRMCRKEGHTTAATIVDHIKKHNGNWDLFADYDNTQSLCKTHHDSTKQSEERRGYSRKIGTDGWPEDERHPVHGT